MGGKGIIVAGLLVSSVLTGGLALYAARYYKEKEARFYIMLMACVTVYTFGYALELHATTLVGIRRALLVEYLGIPFIPILFFLTALTYSRLHIELSKALYGVLFFIPAVTLVLHFTNEYHHLFYKSLELNTDGPFPLADISRGLWYKVNIVYAYTCILAGNLLFLRMVLASSGYYRKQAVTVFFASIIPWGGDLVYQSGFSPYGIDLAPFAFTLTGPLLALGMFGLRLFDFVPIARNTVFDSMQDPVLVLDDADRLADFNRAAERMFASLDKELVGMPIGTILEDHPRLLEQIDEDGEYVNDVCIHCDDSPRIFELSVIAIISRKGHSVGRTIMLHDITRQRQLLEQLRTLANEDGLTGICNHRHFMELAREELHRAVRCYRPVAVLLADLDHFKQINDTYGHQAGDAALRHVAEVFREDFRFIDILGRYGGEEFAAFLPETTPAGGREVADRIRAHLAARPFEHEGKAIEVTVSIGVTGSTMPTDMDSLGKLIGKADEALYLAKKSGRNRVEMLDGDEDERDEGTS